MKTKFLVAIAAAALACGPIAACAPTLPGSITAPLSVTSIDEKAIYGVEATYNAAARTAGAAVDAGLLVPGSDRAVAVADGLQAAYSAIQTARVAHGLGNGAGALLALERAKGAIAGVQGILRPRPG